MLVRPYTITSLAFLLQLLYLVYFLAFVAHQKQSETRTLNRSLALALFMWGVLSVHHVTLTLSSNVWVDTSKVLRSLEVIALMFFACRVVYKMLEEVTDAFVVEQVWFRRLFALLALAEVAVTIGHVAPTWGMAAPPQRPLFLNLPLLLSQLWLIVLAARAWLYVERRHAPERGTRSFVSAILTPRAPLAYFLRNITLAVLAVPVVLLAFVFSVERDVPLWTRALGDAASLFIVLVTTYSYLRYRLREIGLELRIIAPGLALFLTLTAVLGWLITVVFVELDLPGVNLEAVVGSNEDVLFVVDAVYVPMAQRLDTVLRPIMWFQILGSLVFVLGYQLYYRTQIQRAISAILYGIDEFAHERFDHRIPVTLQDELGTIAAAFNQLGDTISRSRQALRAYQEDLETMVADRTAALRAEIDQRLDRELQATLEEERARVAREAHDGVLQSLYTIRMRLRSRSVTRLPASALQQVLAEIADEVLASSRELRAMISAEAVNWSTIPLRQALTVITQRYQTAYEIPIELQIDAATLSLRADHHVAVLRIVQEALSNIGRHSAATNAVVFVRTDQNARQLRVDIEDNGIGFAADALTAGGRGVSNMHERAAQLGGTLSVDSRTAPAPQHGTRVVLRLPLPMATPEADSAAPIVTAQV